LRPRITEPRASSEAVLEQGSQLILREDFKMDEKKTKDSAEKRSMS